MDIIMKQYMLTALTYSGVIIGIVMLAVILAQVDHYRQTRRRR
jgi:hypothetical protein